MIGRDAILLLGALLSLLCRTHCISFMLKSDERRCVREEVHKDVLVVGEYRLSDAAGLKTDLLVADSKGHTLFRKEDASKGKFAFTTEDYDMFEIGELSRDEQRLVGRWHRLALGLVHERKSSCQCWLEGMMLSPYWYLGVHNVVGSSQREVTLTLKHGVEAKSYDDLAKAEKLKPMELELRKLEDLAESIVQDFAYMRAREEEMRDTNESTNTRVLYFSIFSMCCLLCLAAWQVFYLRRFFQAKKLIE